MQVENAIQQEQARVQNPERRRSSFLEPIGGREAAVGLTGAGVGGRGAVALQHLTRLPAGQAHQVGLAAAVGQPLMGEGVPELVGMPALAGRPGGRDAAASSPDRTR
jgi:hypothetical protein